MHAKMVKTVFANHIGHTYKKGTASLHVPGSGLRARPGLGANTGGSAAQRGWAGRESSHPSPGEGRLPWPATHWGLLFRPGDSVRGPLCAQTSRPEQRGLPRRSVPRNQGYSHPPSPGQRWHRAAAAPPRSLPSPSKPSPGAGMWQPGQNRAWTLLTLTSGSTPSTGPERAKERSSYLD